jgi:hypothetical protein
MMTGMDATFEALFVATDSPPDEAALLTEVLRAGSEPAGDGQHLVSGLGTYLVIEPSSALKPSGTVTIWLRTADAKAMHDELVAAGCVSVEAAGRAGPETVAAVRTPQGLNLGLISGSA